ncbi:hypothetical protein HDV00_012808 [Rhizophlyctis rosea]|nr:hypothetical protein HDV00_012808 [Rhizophlyctis rosea]
MGLSDTELTFEVKEALLLHGTKLYNTRLSPSTNDITTSTWAANQLADHPVDSPHLRYLHTLVHTFNFILIPDKALLKAVANCLARRNDDMWVFIEHMIGAGLERDDVMRWVNDLVVGEAKRLAEWEVDEVGKREYMEWFWARGFVESGRVSTCSDSSWSDEEP